MGPRTYGQYCGFARAVELVGERWAFLVLRDLLVAPKRFTDLLRGLRGIPTNILSTRLKELETAGVVRRRLLPRPAGSVVYELTEWGQELEGVVMGLGRWGAKALDQPREGETVTIDSLVMALRTTFRPQSAKGEHCGFELRAGELVLHARVDDGTLEADAGPLPNADLTIDAGPGMKSVMAGEVTPAEAISSGAVRVIAGDPELLASFARMFRIDPKPTPNLVA